MINTLNLKAIDKASLVNSDLETFGSFAEIGAGQEVTRWFFSAGGASHTIAKTMSAYDTNFSDEIYGSEKSGRYVCESRLQKMLTHEYELLQNRLDKKRGKNTRFFVFANTVSTSRDKSKRAHGWLGIKFQHEVGSSPSELIVHINLNDPITSMQQDAVGLVGINLIHAALYLYKDSRYFLEALSDNLSSNNVEIDMIRSKGEAFSNLDNRLLCLELVKIGLSKIIMFGSDGKVYEPSDILYKKNVLIQRGDFRPITKDQVAIQESASKQFLLDLDITQDKLISVMEITMSDLKQTAELDSSDFLARADILSELGFNVMVSNFKDISSLGARIREEKVNNYSFILSERRLSSVFPDGIKDSGGLMQSVGKFFGTSGKMYIYNSETKFKFKDFQKRLFEFLIGEEQIKILEKKFKPECLEVISKIKSEDPSWMDLVPKKAVKVIKDNNYFK